MVKPVDFFKGTVGLNTKADQARLLVDPKTGTVELARANNISIDDSLRPSLRPGFLLCQAGAFHSLYSDKGPCFIVQDRENDSAIMNVAGDLSLSGVRSSLTKGLRVSFKQDGGITYYSNGAQNGIIVDGAPFVWPDQTGHVGRETSRVFFRAPIGTRIEIAHGRMWIIVGNVIWYSEPFAYGKFAMASSYVGLSSKGRIIRGVDNGVWISDEKAIWFYEGTNPAEMRPVKKASYPALEWSDAIDTVDAANYGYEFTPGKSVLMCSTEGICICGPSGEFKNIAEEKIIHPDSITSGATLVRGGNAIHSMWC